MKKRLSTIQRMVAVALVLCAGLLTGWAANTKQTVNEVTETVTLDNDVDYIITSDTPFGTNGVVNITNTYHAVLILKTVKPSAALRLLASHVQIGGEKAVNNTNCQVKMYNRGCIILPYGNSVKPLTVYSEPDFGGESCNDFGLESDGGFMNTLSDKKLNNRIRSFKLKRGYMVTFANKAKGRGYSRCFIAADADLEVSSMPAVLDRSISSYRVFKWYDAGKPQLAAAGGDNSACSALKVTSTYSWNAGTSMLPDVECVSHQIYSGYPSASGCGSVTYTCHMKTSNEPRNTSDDHPEDLKAILNNWESLMATGLRLCTPSSWDGSDYWNATGFLKEFLDSIDARGWRCDIIDLHCYWPENNFGNIKNWANAFKRPVWVSEWCWGASWNQDGAFANGVTESQNAAALKRICNNMNSMDCVERYFFWNGERDPSKVYKNGKLTKAGEMYAELDGGLAYTGKTNYVPKVPPMSAPSGLAVNYDNATHSATLTWHEYNGELNQGIYLERRDTETADWVTIADIPMEESEADYTYQDTGAVNGCYYRVRVVDANGKTRTSKTVMAASNVLSAGDVVMINGVAKYIGGNVIVNGDFDLGTTGWTNGEGKPIGQPYFQVVPVGGSGGGSYLQCYGNASLGNEKSLKTVFDVKAQSDYYFSGASCNTASVMNQLNLSEDGVTSGTTVAFLQNTESKWNTKFATFNTDGYQKAIIAFQQLGAKTQFDQLLLCQLFDTKAAAVADGVEKARLKAAAFKTYNTALPALNTELDQVLTATTGTDEQALTTISQAVATAIQACGAKVRLDSLLTVARAAADLRLPGYKALETAMEKGSKATTAAAILAALQELGTQMDDYLPMTDTEGNVAQPLFLSSTGWTVKCGTYLGGNQRTSTKDGVSYWNAWWSGVDASEGTAKTMAVKQDVKGLGHGVYVLTCQASTDHYCLTDQHAFMTVGDSTVVSPVLTADYFDLPSVSTEERWQTLATLPVYVADNATVTIGFIGSKQGAVDNAWRELGKSSSTGDKREGSWGATKFVLRHHPLYKRTVVPGQWGSICLPYAMKGGEGVRLYEIAGLNTTFDQLYLREVSEMEAGKPCMFKSDQAEAMFLESGTAVKSAVAGEGNLRGYFNTTGRVREDYYQLTNGEWVKVDGSNRPEIEAFSGVMRPITDSYSSPLPVYASWTGPTVPIKGMSDDERAIESTVGVVQSVTVGSQTPSGIYTLDGRRMTDHPLRRGIYIKVENGRARKQVVK